MNSATAMIAASLMLAGQTRRAHAHRETVHVFRLALLLAGLASARGAYWGPCELPLYGYIQSGTGSPPWSLVSCPHGECGELRSCGNGLFGHSVELRCCDAPMSVVSGSSNCEIDSNGCATDGAGSYGNGEECTVRVTQASVLTATEFDTESCCDRVTIAGSRTTAPSARAASRWPPARPLPGGATARSPGRGGPSALHQVCRFRGSLPSLQRRFPRTP